MVGAIDSGLVVLTPLHTGDLVQLGVAVILAVTALAAPYVAEWVKHRFFSPVLRVTFQLSPPDCHLTDAFYGGPMPDYYFRFRVSNGSRKEAARHCHVRVEAISHDTQGTMREYPAFTQVPLNWSDWGETPKTINADQWEYCDFLHLPDPRVQFAASKANPVRHALCLCTNHGLNSQPDRFAAGKYLFQVVVSAENAPTVRASLEVNWSGVWKTTELEMFKEVSIKLL